jgi:hypothetical protein
VLAATGVMWGLPFLAVPFLGLLAVPIAYPSLVVLAFCPVLAIRPGLSWLRTLAGAAVLLAAGFADVALIVQTLDAAHTALLGRRGGPDAAETLGLALAVWGALVVGASVGRGSSVPAAAGFATAFVAVGPLACGVLALLETLGLPLGT